MSDDSPSRLVNACRAIRYLRAKCARIAYLGDGEDAAREALALTEDWAFLDYLEPEDMARILVPENVH